jgi:RHS repeat-associated protein
MTYDADNRLTQATKSGTTVSFAYDWQNHIVTKTIGSTLNTRYVYDGWHVIAEYDGSGNLKQTYIHGPGVDEILLQKTAGGGTYNLLRDHLGSTMALVGALGTTISQRYTYDAYGNVTVRDAAGDPSSASLLTNYLYTGREWQSEIALYNYRNRFYHPEIGRFLQPDPIGFAGGDLSLFEYVSSSVLSQTDPFGLDGGGMMDSLNQEMNNEPPGALGERACNSGDGVVNEICAAAGRLSKYLLPFCLGEKQPEV